MSADTIFTYRRRMSVACRKSIEYGGHSWMFVVSADRYITDHTETSALEISRDEAVRLHRNLGMMLRATAPARPKPKPKAS